MVCCVVFINNDVDIDKKRLSRNDSTINVSTFIEYRISPERHANINDHIFKKC